MASPSSGHSGEMQRSEVTRFSQPPLDNTLRPIHGRPSDFPRILNRCTSIHFFTLSAPNVCFCKISDSSRKIFIRRNETVFNQSTV